MKKLLKYLSIVSALIFTPLVAFAIQISVPSAPGAGYGLISVSNGNYIASSTSPLVAGSNITFTGGTPYVFGPSVTISAAGSSGSAYPFTPTSNFGVIMSATSTPIWDTAGLFASSSSQIASTTFTASGTVGIGSSTPWADLSVSDTNGVTNPLFAIGSSSQTEFVVTESGNVGINTAAPVNLPGGGTGLTVGSSAAIGGSLGFIYSGAVDSVHEFLRNTGSNFLIGAGGVYPLWIGGVHTFYQGAGTMEISYTSNTAGVLQLGVGGTANNNATLSLGEIGIGTTTPSAFLTVVATSTNAALSNIFVVASSTGGTSTTTLLSLNNNGVLQLSKLATAAGTFLAADGSGNIIATTTPSGGGGSGTVGTGLQGQFPFYNANGTTLTATSTLFLTQGGSVGIGITNPGAAFEVQGTTTTSTGNAVDVWNSAGTSLLRARDDGYIGISTTSPYGLLSVNPTAALGTAPAFVIGSSTQTLFSIDGNGITSFLPEPSDARYANGLIKVSSDTSGQLRPGINVTGGGTALATYGNGGISNGAALFSSAVESNGYSVGATAINNGSANINSITFGVSNANFDVGLSRIGTKTLGVGNGVQGNVTGTLDAGFIGIGTTSPLALLDVTATSTNGIGAPTTLFNIASTTLGTATSTIFTVLNRGLIGIGTSTPTNKLSIVQSTTGKDATGLLIDGMTNSANADIELNAGGNTSAEANIDYCVSATCYWQSGIQNNSTNDYEFWDNNDDPVLTIKQTTNAVGIATTTPFGLFAIDADYGDALPGNLIFNVASSSLTATTSMFNISNTGAITASALTVGTGNGALCATTGGLIEYSAGANCVAGGGGASFGQTLAIDSSKWLSATTTGTYGINANVQGSTFGFGLGDKQFIYASTTNQSTILGLLAGGQNATTSATVDNTTAIGYGALNGLLTGTGSTAVGSQSLFLATTSPGNTAIGYWSLRGSGTGLFSTVGENTAVGYWSLASTTSGNTNTAVGYQSGQKITSGSSNVAVGFQALSSNTSLTQNTAIGYQAGKALLSSSNTAVGYLALSAASNNGSSNIAFGANTMTSALTGSNNIAIGTSILSGLTSGSNNTAIGSNGTGNTITSGLNNTCLGYQTCSNINTGYDNLMLGEEQNTGGGNLTTGGGNILIGYNPVAPSVSSNLFLNIGNTLFGTLSATSTATALQLPTSGTFSIGSTSPFAKFSIQANNGDTLSTLFAIGSSTPTATTTLYAIDNVGHQYTSGTAPSITGGTSSVSGNDNNGTITVTGTALTSVTLTFANPWTSAPDCTESDNSTALTADITSISTTQVVFGFSIGINSGTVWYQCRGHR